MQNRFGLKDFVLLVSVFAVAVLVVLTMLQDDRRWEASKTLEAKVDNLEQQVARLDSGVERAAQAAEAADAAAQAGDDDEALRGLIQELAKLSAAQQQTGELLAGLSESVGSQSAELEARLQAQLERMRAEAAEREAEFAEQLEAAAQAATEAAAVERTPWAVEGVEIASFPEPTFATDPREMDGFRHGGEFIESFEARMPKVMPFVSMDVYSSRICGQVFEPLGGYDPETLEFRGVLAEAWQMDPGGRWLRVKIRDRARFSDGRPVTAADVVFTWKDVILNPQIEAERLRSIATQVEDVRAITDKAVEFRFSEPLYTNLTIACGGWVLPKHFYERLTPKQYNESTGLLLGSGPFKLEVADPENQWTPGADFVLVRNESYWGSAKPALRSLRYRVITDDLAALVSYKNGNTHMMRPTSKQFVNNVRDPEWERSNHSLNWVNMRSGYSFIAWQCGERNGRLTPFHDVRVRRAMTHLLDRERIIDEILEGIGEVATGPNGPSSPAHNPEIVPIPYDLDKARALLAEAGWADADGDNILENEAGEEFEFEFTYSQGSDATERIANYLTAQCARVGIRCEQRVVDWSIYVQLLNSRDFDAITLGWSASSPESDPRQIWHSDSIDNQGDNFQQWADERADELIDLGRRTLDAEERMGVWHELHAVIHEEQPYTFLAVRPWLRFVSGRFANVNTYPAGIEQREFFLAPEPAD